METFYVDIDHHVHPNDFSIASNAEECVRQQYGLAEVKFVYNSMAFRSNNDLYLVTTVGEENEVMFRLRTGLKCLGPNKPGFRLDLLHPGQLHLLEYERRRGIPDDKIRLW